MADNDFDYNWDNLERVLGKRLEFTIMRRLEERIKELEHKIQKLENEFDKHEREPRKHNVYFK